jgi:uncharacterized membrane protein SpoIIM required for sporulation
MDIDRFIAANQPSWDRLAALSARARGRRVRQLRAEEVEELVRLYQQASGDLATARTTYAEPGLVVRLTSVVADAGAAVYGRRTRAASTLRRFLVASFPAAVWVCRRSIAAAAVLLLLPAFAVGAWLASSDAALDVAIDEQTQEALLESEFEDYYSSAPAQQFASLVTFNNIRVSILAFALGALLLPCALLLAFNGLNVGVAGGLFVAEGQGAQFFGLILPHGLLELTAVVVAAGAGLQMGWAVVAPGDRTRGAALAEEGRRSVVLVLGTILAFVVAGLVEGFVTPAPIPTALRVGIGALVWIGFLLWVFGLGRDAVADGFSGHPADDGPAWERRRAGVSPAG